MILEVFNKVFNVHLLDTSISFLTTLVRNVLLRF